LTEWLWNVHFSEQYVITYEKLMNMTPPVEELLTSKNFITAKSIIKDMDWLGILKGQYTSWFHVDFTSEEFLSAALAQYKKFLLLNSLEPIDHDTLGPTHPVDLMWHTHQMYPSNYHRDCLSIIGAVLHHDPWPHDRFSQEEMANHGKDAEKSWQQTFGEVEWVWS